jgi:hypothetical protein
MQALCRAITLSITCLLVWSCSSEKSKIAEGGVTVSPSATPATSAATNSEAQGSQIDVCSYFSAADAQSIMGVPMKRSDKTNPQHNCMYEEVKARPNTIGAGTIALTLSQARSVEEGNRDWAKLKQVRHLEGGQKNVHSLSGIGDEAWFTGNTEKGKVGVGSVIARKGKSEIMLDSMVLEYVASPDAMKSVAKGVVSQLP